MNAVAMMGSEQGNYDSQSAQEHRATIEFTGGRDAIPFRSA
jgi:hypothetical protein